MTEEPKSAVPTCVGIIMDGNRRWAKAHSLPAFEGHHEGYKTLQEIVKNGRRAGIPNMVAYAFSTENWKRSGEEVGYIMKLLRTILENEIQKMAQEKVRVRFIGDLSRFDAELRVLMDKAEKETGENYDITLYIAMSYGGRTEIINAVNKLLQAKKENVTEKDFARALYSDMPDPDLIIRTGGEKRLSNFLLWQSAYSELFFTDTYWPDFTPEEFNKILAEFSARERRHGK